VQRIEVGRLNDKALRRTFVSSQILKIIIKGAILLTGTKTIVTTT
jgi:hypothetical protein